ncbi:hypothetical protein Sste5346_004516 [Sporothrix stenoceras]|uniref:Uncharacterized protein n=1 Tax=Sporothrix stenoceras TaxID=5173 RepID=A0ABR3Z9J1_9PEZI
MCIVFTCGEHTFRKEVEGYEGVVCRCYNCGNYSGRVIKTHPWFTLCFVPVIPLSIHGYEDVTCHICNYAQPLEHRQDDNHRKACHRKDTDKMAATNQMDSTKDNIKDRRRNSNNPVRTEP